jgi:hypothetical protein
MHNNKYIMLCMMNQTNISIFLLLITNLIVVISSDTPSIERGRFPASFRPFSKEDRGFECYDNGSFLEKSDIVVIDSFNGKRCKDSSSHGAKVVSHIKSVDSSLKITRIDINPIDDVAYLKALSRAISIKPKVINISMNSSIYLRKERRLIERAANLGIVIVTASANKGTSYSCVYPACYGNNNVIGVAMGDRDLNSITSKGGKGIDYVVSENLLLGGERGTSFATAIVSGMIASKIKQKENYEEEFKKITKKIQGAKYGALKLGGINVRK